MFNIGVIGHLTEENREIEMRSSETMKASYILELDKILKKFSIKCNCNFCFKTFSTEISSFLNSFFVEPTMTFKFTKSLSDKYYKILVFKLHGTKF